MTDNILHEADKLTDIPGWEGIYAVTRSGKVWSYPKSNRKNGAWLKQCNHIQGYKLVGLSINGNTKTHYVHRLVADTYLAKPSHRVEINHKNGRKSDNSIDNLEWVTPKQNIAHAVTSGLRVGAKGEQVASAKLKKADVLKIRELARETTLTQIASDYSVSVSLISMIVNRKRWSHL